MKITFTILMLLLIAGAAWSQEAGDEFTAAGESGAARS